MKQLYKRIKGILIGGALGDAMGMPTELWTQRMIKEEFPNGIKEFAPSMNRGSVVRRMCAGQVTDDTINTKFIIDMLDASHGKISVENYIEQLRIWSRDSEVAQLVSGPSTRKALSMIEEGVPFTETGRFGTTNGAAMKIAPIGIVSDYRNIEELVNKVQLICIPTHNTSIAIAGASGIAAAVSYVSSGKNDLSQMFTIMNQAIQLGMTKGYEVASASLIRRIEVVNELVEKVKEEHVLSELYQLWGTGVETIETIPSVFAIIKMAKGNPMKAACLSAQLGGDTDTIGAIATAICGGIQPDFPTEIVEQLEEVNGLDFDDLTKKIMRFSPYLG